MADRAVPTTRPRGLGQLLLPLPVAVVLGLGAGTAPVTTLLAAVAVAGALVLLLRVEWAALAVVGSAVFEGYLDRVAPWATTWLTAVLVLAWLVRRAQGPLHAHRLRVLAVPGSVLVALLVVATAAHPHGADGWTTAGRLAGLVVVALVLADCLCGPLAPRAAARCYVLACTAASLCGLFTAVLADRHRVVGPVDDADTMAFFLLAALPLVGTVRSSRDQPAWWVWGCFAVLLVAGVGTQSRPAYVALVVMTVLAVATGLLSWRLAGGLLAVVTSAVALVFAVLPAPVEQVLADPQRYSDLGTAQRNEYRRAAWEMTRESPLLGRGPAAYGPEHQDHLDPGSAAVGQHVDTAYSTVLESAAELGLPATGALYAAWLLPAVGALRRWRRDRSRLTAATLLALGGLATASVLESQSLTLPLWLLAALGWALGRPDLVRRPLFPGEAAAAGTSGQVEPRS